MFIGTECFPECLILPQASNAESVLWRQRPQRIHKELVINAASNADLSFNGCMPETQMVRQAAPKVRELGTLAVVPCLQPRNHQGQKVESSGRKATSILSRSLLKAWDRHTGS